MAPGSESCQRDRPPTLACALSFRGEFYSIGAAALPLGPTRSASLTTHTNTDRDIVVNGDRMATRAANLAELIAELGFAGKRIATARNGNFVAEGARKTTAIERDDRIEIVSPRNGG
jgi:sulfur carrier protein